VVVVFAVLLIMAGLVLDNAFCSEVRSRDSLSDKVGKASFSFVM
jgi:hypothetical protein